MAKMSISYVLYRLRYLIWFFTITALFSLFFTPGQIFFSVPQMHLFLTFEGLQKGVITFLQLIVMTTSSFIVFQTTSTMRLVKSLQSIFYPFYLLGMKVPDITLMLLITLQFIPIFLSEGKNILQIHTIRLRADKKKGWIPYIKSYFPLLIPLFHMLIRKVNALALAIELRGYTGEVDRHKFYLPKINGRDIIALFITVFFLGGLAIGAGCFS